MTAPEGRTPATAAGRALLSHATEAYWSHPPLDLLSEIKQGVLAIEAEAAAGVRVAEPELPLTAEQRADLESAIRFREHREKEPGHKSWWRCIPIADIGYYQKLQPIWSQPESGSAGTSGLRPWLERIVAASPGNGESATEYVGRLKGIALAALAAPAEPKP